MKKNLTQKKEKESELREVGPKFKRNVIPNTFQIRRPTSPMADLLDEAERKNLVDATNLFPSKSTEPSKLEESITPVKSTPVKTTPVKTTAVKPTTAQSVRETKKAPQLEQQLLPELLQFVDNVLPLFPPARQAILLRLYRWCEGVEREMIVSTPRLASKTNMDEKICRNHLHALIAEGYLIRSNDGEHIAKFGGSDRNARGLLLKMSAKAFSELLK